MILTAKVSKSYFSFVYGDLRDGSVKFGYISRQTQLSSIPLFKRVPQDCLLYFLKRYAHPAHPKYIKQYLSYLLSLHAAAVDFACEQLAALFREFPQCVLDGSLLEALIYALNVKDFGFSSAQLNVLRILRFAASVEENREFFSRMTAVFAEALALATEEYQQRLLGLASARSIARKEAALSNADLKSVQVLPREEVLRKSAQDNASSFYRHTDEEPGEFGAFLEHMGTGLLGTISDSQPPSYGCEVRYTAAQAYEHQFSLFYRFEYLNTAKIVILLELCAALQQFEVDVPVVCKRQRLYPEMATAALDFLVEKSHFYPLSSESNTWLLSVLREGTLNNYLAVCRIFLNQLRTQTEIELNIEDYLLALYSDVYAEVLKLLQTTEISASHDYVYELEEAACTRLYGLLKAMEIVCALCYRLRYELPCDKLLNVVVAAQQITQAIAIFLVSQRAQLQGFRHLYRLTQIVRRFSAATRNEYFNALLFCLTGEEGPAPTEFRCVQWMREQDSGETMHRNANLYLFREFAAQNYRRMDDVSTVCIDVAVRLIDPGSYILDDMWKFWADQSGELAEFNMARMKVAGAWTNHYHPQQQTAAALCASTAQKQEYDRVDPGTVTSYKVGKSRPKAKDGVQKANRLADNGWSLQSRGEITAPSANEPGLSVAEERSAMDHGTEGDC